MNSKQGVTDFTATPSLSQKIAEGEEISCRLGHLGSLDHKMGAVHPVAYKGCLSMACAFALGNFGLVMGKDIVHSTAVDVYCLTE